MTSFAQLLAGSERSLAAPRQHAKPQGRSQFRGPCVLGLGEPESHFAGGNEAFRGTVVSRWNHWGREICHFAELFVFSDLTPISFRAIRERPPSADETGGPGLSA
jgi:hypothetical protein